MTTVGKVIVNSTLALSIAASLVLTLASIVYADRENQLKEARVVAAQFHTHEVQQKAVETELYQHQKSDEFRINGLERKIDEANAKLDRLMERLIK